MLALALLASLYNFFSNLGRFSTLGSLRFLLAHVTGISSDREPLSFDLCLASRHSLQLRVETLHFGKSGLV